MEVHLLKEDVIPQLWNEYVKTPEYENYSKKVVPANNPIVIRREKDGLTSVYKNIIKDLSGSENIRMLLKNRHPSIWLDEWKEMHGLLFHRIFRNCGSFRKDKVRFGAPGDEDLYHIPDISTLHKELGELAESVRDKLSIQYSTREEKYMCLASIHYEFIRIHPFMDGNGRIGRAITDQLAIFFGFPPAIVGYPRHDSKRREAYHRAIKACTTDPACEDLSGWIKNYIEAQLDNLA